MLLPNKNIELHNTLMKTSAKVVLGLTAVVLLSLLISEGTQDLAPAPKRLLQTYTTTSTRTTNVNNLCPANLDRTTLVSSADKTAAQEQRTEVSNTLGIDGNQLINYATNSKTDQAITMVKENAVNLGIFVATFAVGCVIFIFIWPFLCCCCTCPHCCPSKCCQKAEDEQYSKCELYWPAVVLILALCMTLGASIYGFSKVSTFGPAINHLGCSAAIFVDDLLNGNVTSNGSAFFTGLNTLTAQIDNLNGNLTNINNNLTDLAGTGTSSQTALNDVTAVLGNVQQIPDTTSPFQLTLVYNTPIDANTGTTPSTFKPVLGDYTNSSSLVGSLYTLIQTIQTLISEARTSAGSFSSTFSSVSGQLASIKSSISSIVSSISSVDSNLESPLKNFETAGDNGNLGLQAFYGVFIGFSFFALLGVLLTVCCDKYGCRHLMYFSCVFLFIVGLVGFILVSFISVAIPVITWGCSYLDVTLASETGFKANLDNILGTTVANQLKVCMPFGNGRIVDSIASGSAMDALNNLTTVINTMGSFNNTQSQLEITGNLTVFMGTVSTWCKGDVVDLDSTNFAILQNIANPFSSSWTNCNAPFTTDSWVPSNSQNGSYTTIPCQVSNGNTGDITTCTNTLADNGGNTCGGCMDSTALETIITTANINTHLQSRYGATCSFNTPLTNIWTNYYNPKRVSLGGPNGATTPGTVLKRATDVQASILSTSAGGVFAAMNTIDGLFTSINSSMATINPLVDPKTGLVAGLNCLLFGQDFQRVQDIMCGSMYYNMYIMRLALGISCYGVLFAMCCIVCTGVRHMKHSERKSKVGDAFFKGKEDYSGAQLKGKY